jgi:malonyl-CoA/methylmalonyl-CoA synthetase
MIGKIILEAPAPRMSFLTDPYEWIESCAHQGPERVFLQTPAGRRLTYETLHRQSAAWAAALSRLGLEAGDRIAVRVGKSIESILLYLACLRMGAVYVPINTDCSASEVEYFLQDAQARLAIVRPADAAALSRIAARTGVADLQTLGAEREGTLAELVERCDAQAPPRPSLQADALAAIIYTSGTTGRSKGAMLTRGNLASNATTLAAAWRFSASDVLLHMLPLFHVHGLFAALNTVLASGSSLLLVDGFDAAQALRYFPAVTVFMGVPTYYTRLLQLPALGRDSTAQIRLFVSGSAPLSAATYAQFEQRTGHAILERYGMTETLMNTSNPYDGPRLPGSVGPALPGIAVRIVDTVSGRMESTPDLTGAVEIKGPNVCAGYWHDPEKTRAAFSADGWFKSGDLGRLDPNGYLHIVGRSKDLVISGGYNVYPKEVEIELDALAEVLESAVFGLPHPDFGEGVTAVVVTKPGARISEAQIITVIKTRLARYKVPKRVLIVDELPRNAMGKVQKNTLRKRYASLYQSV